MPERLSVRLVPPVTRWTHALRQFLCVDRLIAFAAGVLFSLHGHANRLQFEPVMNESYPNVAETMDIIQDNDGFIWVGGSNGLARFDGKSFTLFQYDADNGIFWWTAGTSYGRRPITG